MVDSERIKLYIDLSLYLNDELYNEELINIYVHDKVQEELLNKR